MLTHLPSCSFGRSMFCFHFPFAVRRGVCVMRVCTNIATHRRRRPLYETPLSLLLPRNEWSLIKNKPAASQLRTNHYTTDYVICRLCPLLLLLLLAMCAPGNTHSRNNKNNENIFSSRMLFTHQQQGQQRERGLTGRSRVMRKHIQSSSFLPSPCSDPSAWLPMCKFSLSLCWYPCTGCSSFGKKLAMQRSKKIYSTLNRGRSCFVYSLSFITV